MEVKINVNLKGEILEHGSLIATLSSLYRDFYIDDSNYVEL